jgi:hypothetical protein
MMISMNGCVKSQSITSVYHVHASIIRPLIDLLKPLQIDADEVVPFPFFCGVESLDAQSIMIDKLGPRQWIASQLSRFLRVTAIPSGWLLSPPHHMLAMCEDLDITLPGLPRSVLPIQSKTFTHRSAKHQATFYQFPVTMAYAITDYKCQSLTFEQVVVDLKCPSTSFAPATSTYVQLSRC